MVNPVFKKIILYLQASRPNPVELRHLENDLKKTLKRLEAGEYKVRDFSTQGVFDYQRRTDEFYGYLKSYTLAGRTYSKIFEALKIEPHSTFLELCPGFAPKIALGLYHSNFKGNLILADKNNKATQKLIEFMHLFKIDFLIQAQQKDVFFLKGAYKGVIGNHAIDDLILNDYCLRHNLDDKMPYESEEVFYDCWQNILTEKKRYEDKFCLKIAQMIDNVTEGGGFLLLTQYPGMMERLLKLDDVIRFNQNILERIDSILTKRGWSNEAKLIGSALKNFDGYFKPKDCLLMLKPN